jgi:succinate-semialdehyde dehydrogenase/glutarate-semialdehyde dehydrogenase
VSVQSPVTDNGTLFIDGKWRHATSSATFTSTNPATSEVLGVISDAGPDEAADAVAAAAAAAAGWAARTAYERAAVLLQAHRLMIERADDLALLMTTEQGKPLRAARNEVGYAADFLIWFAEEAKRIYGSTIPSARGDQRFVTLHQPVGVVAAITPWNYPMSMITRKVGPALAAGCTVVLKPAEQTPLCAVAIFQLLEEAGLPPGVTNLLTTSNPAPVGNALLTNDAVRKLTFTGSTEVGKLLAATAAGTVKRVSLELGGHAPFVVFGDADPVHAAKGAALVKFLNTGQACISPNRIFVQRDIYPEFLRALSERVAALRAGNGAEPGITIGPLIDESAMEKMERHVGDAVGKGARLLAGGGRLAGDGYDRGAFFAPTLLSDITPEMLIYREETFGPIAAVTPFDDEDEVIAMANDTAYGLASYLYTRDLSRAIRVSEALRFAIVGVNDINPTSAAAPFGGMKESGLGREGGQEGITEYLETKLIGLSV